jgi:hypothetical protein
MRLSQFAASTKVTSAVTSKVLATVLPVLDGLGAGADPEGWMDWGDNPTDRWTFLAPTAAGLATVNVRVNIPGEGPRSAGKVTRWGRLQVGELTMEAQGEHRVAVFQLENRVFRGVDETADAIADFAIQVYQAIDGRLPVVTRGSGVPELPRSAG